MLQLSAKVANGHNRPRSLPLTPSLICKDGTFTRC